VNLDAYGSFVWMAIDGQRTIGEICNLMRREFGDGAEPVHERICAYMKILRNNKFITLESGKPNSPEKTGPVRTHLSRLTHGMAESVKQDLT
jgi:hypothetical protein